MNGDFDMSEEEVLIVVSKLKKYVKSQSGLNTSGNVAPALSAIVRKLCEKAIQNAQNDGRKTVMDRDFPEISEIMTGSTDTHQNAVGM